MRIGDLAAAAGVSTRALRYYEEQGLLAPARSAGGHRSYGPDAVERVRWIQRLFAAGLSSKAILGLPPCAASDADVDAILDRLVAERGRIDAQIQDLAVTRDSLDDLITAAELQRTRRT
ncbi:MerR family transcriptional regulator [Dactylosporangium sp. NPDC048998]|uniref:MerR family transcriptional regulator n=1 Tax=Dactylosporangium sp. NPDC048998 TaxID=3363976 RepID=UPI0037186FBB